MKDTLFIGKITATATHEIKNVLAIIRESGGLMQDFLNMVPDGVFQHKDRFLKILSNIEEQVVRGDDISTQLNRFGHAPDTDVSSENTGEMIDQMIELTKRIAKARQMTFRNASGKNHVLLRCDPLKVRKLIFQGMQFLMAYGTPGDDIAVRSSTRDGKKVVIEFDPGTQKITSVEIKKLMTSEEWKDLELTAESLNSRAGMDHESGVLCLEFTNLNTI